MNFRLSNQARNDLRKAYRYTVANFGEAQADRYLSRLYDTFDVLCRHPEAGRLASIDQLPATRKILSDKYFIYYDPTYEFIAILRIFHASRHIDDSDIEPFQ